ncbi:MAG: metal ABC transporter ATP-binding protein [Desulfuromonadaceae bacterium]|nr:metal ABC transporter ATP-binding protein [Desulfuromonadaceae bacterium]MDD2854774.1 metal ABC transporter ATP-binding protein [Desulfuromonadaceae bacterium]
MQNSNQLDKRRGLHEERACCTRLIDVGVRFEGKTALQQVNLHVHCGELTAIVGPNGAGKTTLLRAIMGEISHSGELLFQPAGDSDQQKRPQIGYVPQRIEIDKSAPLTVLDLFAATGTRWPLWLWYPKKIRDEAYEALNLVGGAELIERNLGRLSCGQLQRVLLALALKPVPQLLLLDEPLAGLDHAGTAQFYEIVSGLRRYLDLSILLVSHDLNAAASIADRMVFINDKTLLFDGTPAEVLKQEDVRLAFGLDDEPVSSAFKSYCAVDDGTKE